jgi:hypothetical protein
VVSGAESFIAGTASCRVEVQDVDELHRVLDPDRNLITFYQRKQVRQVLRCDFEARE